MEMEVDEGVGGGGSGGGGEGGSGVGESVETAKKNSPEVEAKGKRKMKTPSQLEVLEKTYASEFHIVSLSLSLYLKFKPLLLLCSVSKMNLVCSPIIHSLS